MKKSMWLALLALLFAVDAAAQGPVFLVRHAERADTATGAAAMTGADPDLSAAGQARARTLAAMLKDAGITAIFTTEFKRTQQTAAPLAAALGITLTEVSSKDSAGLAQKVKAAAGPVLVVGHSNTVPEVISALGIAAAPKIAETDYDNLFIVLRGEKPVLTRLHY